MQKQKRVHELINAERERQELLWGQQDHSPALWLAILMEEVGEVAKTVNENPSDCTDGADSYIEELVQVAAVAVAMIESVIRNGWQ